MFRTQGSPPLSRFDASNARIDLPAVQFNLGLAFGDAAPPLGTHPDNTQSFIPTPFPNENKEGVDIVTRALA